nr:uncharacterized protein LOC111751960 [Loxodonta africana]
MLLPLFIAALLALSSADSTKNKGSLHHSVYLFLGVSVQISRAQVRGPISSLRDHLLEDVHLDPILMMETKIVVLNRDHPHKEAIHKIIPHLLLKAHKGHPYLLLKANNDRPHLLLETNKDHAHLPLQANKGHPHKEAVNKIVPHLLLKANKDHPHKETINKIVLKANNHHPSNLEFSCRYDSSSFSIKGPNSYSSQTLVSS